MQKRIIHTGIQEMVLEKDGDEIALILDGELQFLRSENPIYDAAMVDIPMRFLTNRSSVKALILGGGDGLLAKKLLAYPNVTAITLCELDGEVVDVCKTDPDILEMNSGSLSHPSVQVIIGDAYEFVRSPAGKHDLILADFPDAHLEVLSKLFSQEFYRNVSDRLADDGVFVTLSCEVNYTPRCFGCVGNTLRSVFPNVRAYFASMRKSYGDIGIYMASKRTLE